jgi:hypothetical protein
MSSLCRGIKKNKLYTMDDVETISVIDDIKYYKDIDNNILAIIYDGQYYINEYLNKKSFIEAVLDDFCKANDKLLAKEQFKIFTDEEIMYYGCLGIMFFIDETLTTYIKIKVNTRYLVFNENKVNRIYKRKWFMKNRIKMYKIEFRIVVIDHKHHFIYESTSLSTISEIVSAIDEYLESLT